MLAAVRKNLHRRARDRSEAHLKRYVLLNRRPLPVIPLEMLEYFVVDADASYDFAKYRSVIDQHQKNL